MRLAGFGVVEFEISQKLTMLIYVKVFNIASHKIINPFLLAQRAFWLGEV
jgi:hypothetical protein